MVYPYQTGLSLVAPTRYNPMVSAQVCGRPLGAVQETFSVLPVVALAGVPLTLKFETLIGIRALRAGSWSLELL